LIYIFTFITEKFHKKSVHIIDHEEIASHRAADSGLGAGLLSIALDEIRRLSGLDVELGEMPRVDECIPLR
jgi:hypothetical protein